MPTDFTKFGIPILLGDDSAAASGNGMIKKFLGIKRDYKIILRAMATMAGDDDAKRFFCEDDCVYIFPRTSIEALKAALDNGGTNPNDCIVLFYGCREDESSTASPKPCGRPTVIALPYKYNDTYDTINRVPVTITIDDNIKTVDGFEHPGGLKGADAFVPITGGSGPMQANPTIYGPVITLELTGK